VINNGEPAAEANGLAAFKEDKLVGYLSPDETKYFLFATDKVDGGILTASYRSDGVEDISLEISKSKTERSYSISESGIKVTLKPKVDVFLAEIMIHTSLLEKETIEQIETISEEMLRKNMEVVIQKVQTEFETDIFGFGNLIFKKDPKLWKQLSSDWDQYFKNLEIEIKPEIHIVNTALLKES
jgi:spore germination protein KC